MGYLTGTFRSLGEKCEHCCAYHGEERRKTYHFVPLGIAGAKESTNLSSVSVDIERDRNIRMYGSGCFMDARSFSAFSKIIASALGSCTFLDNYVSVPYSLYTFAGSFDWRHHTAQTDGRQRTTIAPDSPIPFKLGPDLNRLRPPYIPSDGPV